jgi:hypothetical protein
VITTAVERASDSIYSEIATGGYWSTCVDASFANPGCATLLRQTTEQNTPDVSRTPRPNTRLPQLAHFSIICLDSLLPPEKSGSDHVSADGVHGAISATREPESEKKHVSGKGRLLADVLYFQ